MSVSATPGEEKKKPRRLQPAELKMKQHLRAMMLDLTEVVLARHEQLFTEFRKLASEKKSRKKAQPALEPPSPALEPASPSSSAKKKGAGATSVVPGVELGEGEKALDLKRKDRSLSQIRASELSRKRLRKGVAPTDDRASDEKLEVDSSGFAKDSIGIHEGEEQDRKAEAAEEAADIPTQEDKDFVVEDEEDGDYEPPDGAILRSQEEEDEAEQEEGPKPSKKKRKPKSATTLVKEEPGLRAPPSAPPRKSKKTPKTSKRKLPPPAASFNPIQ